MSRVILTAALDIRIWKESITIQCVVSVLEKTEAKIEMIILRRKTKVKMSYSKESMDKLSLGFCEKLYIVNDFVTEIIAGHVTRIGRETDLV